MDYRYSHLHKGADYDATLAASPFDAYMGKWGIHYLVQIIQRLYPDGIPRYLDFACGTGRITRTVAPLAKESYGVDVAPSMLEVARETCPNTRFVCADLTQETADLGLFDVVTSFRFFGNAQHALRVGALQALNRLLRPDGHLIINSHRNPHALAALLHNATGGAHGMDLNYFKLKGLLRAHGFRIVYRRAIGFWLFRARLMRQAQLSKAPDWFLESMFRYPCFVPFAPDVVVLAEKSKAL